MFNLIIRQQFIVSHLHVQLYFNITINILRISVQYVKNNIVSNVKTSFMKE